MKKTPEAKVARAGKRVGKAVTVFTKAVDELDAAAAEQIAVADDYAVQAGVQEDVAYTSYHEACDAAEQAYNDAVALAKDVKRAQLAEVNRLSELSHATFDQAETTQEQADKLRSLLVVG